MSKPLRPCIVCGVATNASRCPEHRLPERKAKTAERGYDAKWRRIRAEVIRRQPWCSDCGTLGTPDNPLSADHLRWPCNGPEDAETVCRRCNSRRGPLRGERARQTPPGTSPGGARVTLPRSPEPLTQVEPPWIG